MSAVGAWYRSANPAPAASVSLRRRIRDWVRGCLPEPDVRGRVMVMQSRTTLPSPSRTGMRAQYHGLFSEFHSVLGGVHYAREKGAAGLRIDFRSPLYVDAARGPNWWLYFFERDQMTFGVDSINPVEIRLDARMTKYGRYGGFSDIVQGATPYFYPMTHGLDRATLHGYVRDFATPTRAFQDRARQLAAGLFAPGAFIVGVHYRGTDAVHRWVGPFRHYRTRTVPFAVYGDEVRRVLEHAAPAAFQIFVATDERAFLDFMRREFGGAVVALDAPRAVDGTPVHLDAAVPPAAKGDSAVLDALLLASTDYLVKGRSNLSDASLVFNPGLPYSFHADIPIPS